MNANATDGKTLTEFTVSVTVSGKKPDFRKTGAELLSCCREYYQNPENERKFREWMSERKKEAKGA